MPSATESLPRLATPRITLRSALASDALRVAELASDYDVARMTTSIPYPLTARQARAFLEHMEASDPAREALFAIETAEAGLIGLIELHPFREPTPELGYWLGRPYWGQGYATEATNAALAWAGGEWGKRYIVAGHFTDNPASAAVLIKAGFLYTGRVEHRYCVARGEEAPTRMMVWLP
jgi:RimJ/RimL family protein N-acetyltransferase